MFLPRHFEPSSETSVRRREACAGFTLIEALVALAIVAICLSAIGSLMATNFQAPSRLQHRLELAETLRAIETGLPDRATLTPGTLSGEMYGHEWLVEILPWPEQAADPANPIPWIPQAVAVTAQSPSGATLRIETIRLRQRPSP
ncbi:type II secretion system protein [Methylocapsa acidiphila]|uniref:type II secretion system protein n=1 Tax=Methylocapsa acidiphila TaxID=133552 RepID=UPI0004244DC1|nr:prepilin-type N-terminal cleavage/methylation domain-containing protein [Methylocapsa acidiphila]